MAGRQWEFRGLFRVGRNPNQDVFLDDASVSKQHAEVQPNPQGWVIRDLGSTNGTYVNGVRLGKNAWKLRASDVIQCGNVGLAVAPATVNVPATY